MDNPRQPEPPRFFLDSSVIIAGVASHKGASRGLLTLAEIGIIRVIVSPFAVNETERNLRWKLPDALPYFRKIQEAINWESVADPAQADVHVWASLVPLKDAPIIAAAVIAKPHRLVTLDVKHLIEPTEVAERSGLAIRTPAQVLTEIRQYIAEGFARKG